MSIDPCTITACCPSSLRRRSLLMADRAGLLEDLFKVLASSTRLRLLHALARAGELRVSDLAEAVRMRPQAVSNQLQRLTALGVVGSRRQGTSIRYRLVNPCVAQLLDLGLCVLEDFGKARKPRLPG